MKREQLLSIFLFLVANGSSAITPITGFTDSNYSGQGEWLQDDGSVGTFSAFLDLEPSSWTLARFEVANLFVYKTNVTIDSEGFLSAEMIDETDPLNPIYYPGYGNCGTNYCQTNVYLYNGNLWNGFFFHPDNTISFYGAINFDDGSPNVQWEGSLILLP